MLAHRRRAFAKEKAIIFAHIRSATGDSRAAKLIKKSAGAEHPQRRVRGERGGARFRRRSAGRGDPPRAR
jgi:hypothetical protein